MALGDGNTWDETEPTDSTVAVNIDDYNRDLRKGIRGRLALEHEFPDSQSATSEAGRHRYISFINQATRPAPAIAGTQIGGLYVKTQGLFFVNTATQEIQIVNGTDVGSNKILISSTDTSAEYLDGKLDGSSIKLVNTTAGTESIGVGNIAGVWNTTLANNTVYQATADGFVLGYSAVGQNLKLTGFTDAGTPPTAIVQLARVDNADAIINLMFPVKKSDYWKVTGCSKVSWLPIGV